MKNILVILTIFALAPVVSANPIVGTVHPLFEHFTVPLLIESLLIAYGIKIIGVKFFPTLAFWFLFTNITFLCVSNLLNGYLDSESYLNITILELIIVLTETMGLRIWVKRQISKNTITYPLILVFFANLISFTLGTLEVIK